MDCGLWAAGNVSSLRYSALYQLKINHLFVLCTVGSQVKEPTKFLDAHEEREIIQRM